MACGNPGCNCCGGFTLNPASLTVDNLLGVNPCNQVLLKNGPTTGVFYFDFETGKVSVHDGSAGRPICLDNLQPASEVFNLVGQTGEGCLVGLTSPITNSVMFYDTSGNWKDGSADQPICLTELQDLQGGDTLAYMVGMTTAGCLVKIPITQEDIQTCPVPGGPILTVITTAVS